MTQATHTFNQEDEGQGGRKSNVCYIVRCKRQQRRPILGGGGAGRSAMHRRQRRLSTDAKRNNQASPRRQDSKQREGEAVPRVVPEGVCHVTHISDCC